MQYFYEPFLEAFDPELRKELGVWYTPPEIVEYMVARVDTVLREELDIADGLADPRVWCSTPAAAPAPTWWRCSTRSPRPWTKRAATRFRRATSRRRPWSRVFGFEILPAPFVIATCSRPGARTLRRALCRARNERAGVFLTNALTGWEPPTEPNSTCSFPELEMERDAAADVKQNQPILVILGNPPYNGFAGMAVDEERDLVEAYRQVDKVAPPQGQGLNDLYVRFFRMAERRITEGKQGEGIVCFISNYSWLDGLSFTGMRERFLEVFDNIWIDCLNGDKYKTGKLTPEGKPDPSVFSTEHNREGIQVGTAIALLARSGSSIGPASIRFTNHWGNGKLARLTHPTLTAEPPVVRDVTPSQELGLPFVPSAAADGYIRWPTLPSLHPHHYPGVQAKRDDLVVDIDKSRLEERMALYFSSDVSDEDMARQCPRAMQTTARFDAGASRAYLVGRGMLSQHVVRYAYRPFDVRWIYWEPETRLLGEKVATYFPRVRPGNLCIVSQQQPRRSWSRPQATERLVCLDLMDRGASAFPLDVSMNAVESALFEPSGSADHTNLSSRARDYLGSGKGRGRDLMGHAMAVMHSLQYATENAGALRHDWPHIPLPAAGDALLDSADLGHRVAALLDVESPVGTVTNGAIRYELRPIGPPSKADGGQINPDIGDLAVTAGWGHAGQGGVTMPGRGRLVERAYTPDELALMREGLADLGLSFERLMSCLGGSV